MRHILFLLLTTLLSACGSGGSNSIDYSASRYTVSLTVAGLSAGKQVVLTDGSNNVTATLNSIYTFPTQLQNNSQYQVSITTQPIGQTCTIAYGSGTISSASISNVLVNCSTNPAPNYTIGITASGLGAGKTAVVTNGIDSVSITANTSYTFTTQQTNSTNYLITVTSQPVGQFCFITNGSGTVNNANVITPAISCTTDYSFNGSNFLYTPNVTGIPTGNGARTYNIWVKLDVNNLVYCSFISQGTLSSNRRSVLGISTVAGQSVQFNNGAGNVYIWLDFQVKGVWSSKFTLNDTDWHMYSAVFDPALAGNGVSLYFDGSPLPNPIPNPQNGFTKALVDTTNYNDSITIGGETYDGVTLSAQTGLNGNIRNAAAWNVGLSDAEIASIYSTSIRPSTGLIFTKD